MFQEAAKAFGVEVVICSEEAVASPTRSHRERRHYIYCKHGGGLAATTRLFRAGLTGRRPELFNDVFYRPSPARDPVIGDCIFRVRQLLGRPSGASFPQGSSAQIPKNLSSKARSTVFQYYASI
jgi:hypothetical protein